MPDRRALLLLGPTASGKTPLGDALQASSSFDNSYVHFDFGHRLRMVLSGNDTHGLSDDGVQTLKSAVSEGRLLTDDEFHLAECIFSAFASAIPVDQVIVLNGLPRHVAQAKAMDHHVTVETVVELRCTENDVFQRIDNDPAGDREFRQDDAKELVQKKLAIYRAQTTPVLEYYRAKGARMVTLAVSGGTQTADLLNALRDELT